jgi:hypothetical protein
VIDALHLNEKGPGTVTVIVDWFESTVPAESVHEYDAFGKLAAEHLYESPTLGIGLAGVIVGVDGQTANTTINIDNYNSLDHTRMGIVLERKRAAQTDDCSIDDTGIPALRGATNEKRRIAHQGERSRRWNGHSRLRRHYSTRSICPRVHVRGVRAASRLAGVGLTQPRYCDIRQYCRGIRTFCKKILIMHIDNAPQIGSVGHTLFFAKHHLRSQFCYPLHLLSHIATHMQCVISDMIARMRYTISKSVCVCLKRSLS